MRRTRPTVGSLRLPSSQSRGRLPCWNSNYSHPGWNGPFRHRFPCSGSGSARRPRTTTTTIDDPTRARTRDLHLPRRARYPLDASAASAQPRRTRRANAVNKNMTSFQLPIHEN